MSRGAHRMGHAARGPVADRPRARLPLRVGGQAEPLPVPATERPPEPGPRGPTPGRLVAVGLEWTAIGLLLGLFAAITVPSLFGYQVLTVRSGSMTPTIHTGDVIVVDTISPLDARVGDVVSYRMPDHGAVLVTHRVEDLEVGRDVVRFETRGDANTTVDRWTVPIDGTIGRVVYRVPRVGYLVGWLDQRFIRIGLIAVPVLLLGVYELVRIWRPRPAPGRGDDAPA